MAFRGLSEEPREYIRAWRTLKGTDVFIIPGTDLLTDAFALAGWGPYGSCWAMQTPWPPTTSEPRCGSASRLTPPSALPIIVRLIPSTNCSRSSARPTSGALDEQYELIIGDFIDQQRALDAAMAAT
jgi:hypothetical protein